MPVRVPTGHLTIRERIHHLIEVEADDVGVERAVNLFLVVFIVANVVAVMLETVEALDREYANYFQVFEVSSVVVFTVEYLLRLWTCTVNARYRHPVGGRVRF